MRAAGPDPAVPGVSTVSGWRADLPEHEGGEAEGQAKQEVFSLGTSENCVLN